MASRRSISWSSWVRCGALSDASGLTLKMKYIIRAASRAQATAMSRLLIIFTSRFPVRFALRAGEEFGVHLRATGRSESGFVAPAPDDFPNEHECDQWHDDGHDPGEQVETFFRRLNQDGRTVLFDHGLKDLVVGFTASYVRVEIFLHAAGGLAGAGEGAARMVAEAGGVFAAAAHAEHALTERFGTRGLLGGGGRQRARRQGCPEGEGSKPEP